MELIASHINKYFDHVYVLNLERRHDRKIAMVKKLSRLGIKAEFVEAINGYSENNAEEHQHYLEKPIGGRGSHKLEREYKRKLIKSPGAWGYLKTYYGILQDAKKRNFQRILCFDDDVVFHNDFENQFKEAIQRIPDDWKLLYLGASQYVWKIPQGLNYPNKNKKKIDKNEPFYFPNNTDGSFAMGIHSSAFDLLLSDILKMNCPFDSGALRTVICKYPKSCFVLNPNIVIADVSDSDIRDGQDQQKLAERLRWELQDYDFNIESELVSVIMPAYNAEKTIEKAIKSILLQSYSDLELIVVDDASTDNTVEIVQKMLPEDSRVRLVTLEKNMGVGGARNAGLRESKGSFIAFQDTDDISVKDRIAKQLVPIYEKGVLFTVSKIYRSRCSMDELDISDQPSMIALVKDRRKPNWKGEYAYEDQAHIGLVTTVYKREVFEKYGFFDEHRFGEDLEFVERILYFLVKEEFYKGYNGHTYLSQNGYSPKVFQQLDEVLFVCSAMDADNLTVQFGKKQKENYLRSQIFRDKYRSIGMDAYPKLDSIKTLEKGMNSILYNTISIDNFKFPLDFKHQILVNSTDETEAKQSRYSKMKLIYNTIRKSITSLLGSNKNPSN